MFLESLLFLLFISIFSEPSEHFVRKKRFNPNVETSMFFFYSIRIL